jgi:hypothetical protein
MRPLPVDIAVITAAQLRGGHIDERVGTALRRGPRLATIHPVTHRIDRGLEQGAAFGIELTTHDEHTAIGLIAVQPATLVRVIGIGEHAVGIDAEPGGAGEETHPIRLERLRRFHEDVLVRPHLLHPDIPGEVGDHRDVGEGSATGTSAVEHGRELAEGPGQMHAIRGRLGRHATAASQP